MEYNAHNNEIAFEINKPYTIKELIDGLLDALMDGNEEIIVQLERNEIDLNTQEGDFEIEYLPKFIVS